MAGHGGARSSATYRGHGGDSNGLRALTLAREATMAGLGGRGDGGGAMGEMGCWVVSCGQHASMAEAHGDGDDALFHFGERGRAR